MSKRLGGIKGCKYKTSSWHLNGFPDGNNIDWVNSIMSGRSPPLYCTLTLFAMQGHQKNIKNKRLRTKQRLRNTPSHMVIVVIYYVLHSNR